MKIFGRFSDNTVQPTQDAFDRTLKKAVTVLSLNAVLCIVGSVVFNTFWVQNSSTQLVLFALPFYLLVFILNRNGNVLAAITLLFMSSCLLLTVYCILSGQETYTHIHFVNNIFGLALLYNKEKLKKHFYLNLAFIVACVVFVLLCYNNNWFSHFKIVEESYETARSINFVILVFCSLIFSLVIVTIYDAQHKTLRDAVDEQKTLLAEVNHRVKNNLAVIVSLLNLKRDMSVNSETKSALNECRNRVMSMALVHQKMYQSKSKTYVAMQPYIDDLVQDIKSSLNFKKEIKVELLVEDIQLSVINAIPMGLILNELITNSFKHAFHDVAEPEIKISLHELDKNQIRLLVKDNGKGGEALQMSNKDSLGLSLISSLTEQMDGKSSFAINLGLEFTLTFAMKD